MKIVFLNGNPLPANHEFDDYLTGLADTLQRQGHKVATLPLREMDIRPCVGCFGCWVKDPGQCLAKDDSHIVCRSVVQSELVVFASPVTMGFISALLKKTMDKMIPIIHPYFDLERGEVHHRRRYDRYPRMGMILEKTAGTDDEDIQITRELVSRTARNMKSSLAFTCFTHQPLEEAVDEINRL